VIARCRFAAGKEKGGIAAPFLTSICRIFYALCAGGVLHLHAIALEPVQGR